MIKGKGGEGGGVKTSVGFGEGAAVAAAAAPAQVATVKRKPPTSGSTSTTIPSVSDLGTGVKRGLERENGELGGEEEGTAKRPREEQQQ